MIRTDEKLNINEYRPTVVSAPGDTLLEIIEDRGMSQLELSERLGLSQKTVNEIIKGKAPVSHDTAMSLERVLGISAGFWNRLEAQYREFLARREQEKQLAAYTDWLATIPWKEAAKRRWIMHCGDEVEQVGEVLSYFAVASPKQFEEVYGALAVQWRKPERLEGDSGALAIWLRRGEILASGISCAPYDAKKFEACLIHARQLTRLVEPSQFIPELTEICASAGVAVVFVPNLQRTYVCGAARWLGPSRAIIQLSNRYRWSDSLWFNFFHEGAHILKHPKKEVYLEAEGMEKDDRENEADRFAEDILIPPRELRRFLSGGSITERRIHDFAQELNIGPASVVGRLQSLKIIGYNKLNHLRYRYTWPSDH